MKKFEVEVRQFIVIDAENLQEGNRMMDVQYPDLETIYFFEIGEGINHEVIGHCEISGLSIFEGDEFECDSEGVMWLKSEAEG